MSIRKITGATSSLVVGATTVRSGIFKATTQQLTGIQRLQATNDLLITKATNATAGLIARLNYDTDGGVRTFLEYLFAPDQLEFWIYKPFTENLAATDFVFLNRGFDRRFYETVTAAEVIDLIFVTVRTFTEAVNMVDTDRLFIGQRKFETLRATDTDQLFLHKVLSDNNPIADADALWFRKVLSENITNTDAESYVALKRLTDIIAETDQFVKFVQSVKTETLTAAERAGLSLSRPFADVPVLALDADRLLVNLGRRHSVTLSDTQPTFFINKRINDTQPMLDLVGVFDGISYGYSLARSSTATVSDYFARIFNAIRGVRDGFADSIVISDPNQLRLIKTIRDDISESDAVNFSNSVRKTETAVITDERRYLLNKRIADITTQSDTESYWANLRKIETVPALDAILYALGRAYADSVTITDPDRLFVAKVLADQQTAVDRNFFLAVKALTDSTAQSDTNRLFAVKVLADQPTVADRNFLLVSKPVIDSTTQSDKISTWINKTLRDTGIMIDAFMLNDGSTYSIWKSYFDSQNITDQENAWFNKVLADTAIMFDQYTISDGLTFNAYKYIYDNVAQPDTDQFYLNKSINTDRVLAGTLVSGNRVSGDVLENVQFTNLKSTRDIVFVTDQRNFWANKALTDFTTELDTISRLNLKRLTDASAVPDAEFYLANKSIRDTQISTDAEFYLANKSIRDTQLTADLKQLLVGTVLKDSVAQSETDQLLIGKGNNSNIIAADIDFFWFNKFIRDNQTVDETILVQKFAFSLARNVADSSTVTDLKAFAFSKQLTDTQPMQDLLGIFDGLNFYWINNEVDNLQTSDTDVFLIGKRLPDSTVTTDANRLLLLKSATPDSTVTTDANRLLLLKSATPDSTVTTDANRLLINKGLLDNSTATDANRLLLLKTVTADRAVPTDANRLLLLKSATPDSTVITDANRLLINKQTTDISTVTDVKSVGIGKSLSESSPTADRNLLLVNKTVKQGGTNLGKTYTLRGNSLFYSQDFSNVLWNYTAGVTSISSTATIAPNGTLTANKIILTGATNPQIGQYAAENLGFNGDVYEGVTFTASVWAWTDPGQPTDFKIILHNGAVTVVGQTSITITTVPTRYQFTYRMPEGAGSGVWVQYRPAAAPVAGNYLYMWGAQVEQAPNAGDYAFTAGSIVIERLNVNTDTDVVYVGKNIGGKVHGSAFESTPFLISKTAQQGNETFLQPGNILPWSQVLTSGSWFRNGMTVSSTAAIAPDGTLTANRITLNGVTDPYIGQGVNISPSGKTITSSIWAWIDAGQPTFLQLYLYDNTVTQVFASAVTLTTTPTRYRFTAKFPTSASTSFNVRFDPFDTPTTGSTLYVWGAQAEFSTLAGNYVPTTTAAITPFWNNTAASSDVVRAGAYLPGIRYSGDVLENVSFLISKRVSDGQLITDILTSELSTKLLRKDLSTQHQSIDYGFLLMQNYAGALYFAEDYVGYSDYFNYPFSILLADSTTVADRLLLTLNSRRTINELIAAADSSTAWITLQGNLQQQLTSTVDLQTETTPDEDLQVTGKSLLTMITELGLTDNLKLCLDAGDTASYNPVIQSTKWLDLSGNGYDFFRGESGTGDAAEATFTGVAGDLGSNEYWNFDGADYFTYDAVNETWMNNFHQSGIRGSMICMFYNAGSGAHNHFGNTDATTGFIFSKNATNQFRVFARNAAAATVFSYTPAFTKTAVGWTFMGFGMNEPDDSIVSNFDGVVDSSTCTYVAASTGAAQDTVRIASNTAAGLKYPNGSRLACLAVWEGQALTEVDLAALHNQLRLRFGPV